MGRKRKTKTTAIHMNATAPIIPEITAEEILADANPEIPSDVNSSERRNISFVEKDGKIAFDEMRESHKENLREFFNRPEVQAEFGAKPKPENVTDEKFDEDEANALLDFLQPVLAIGGSKILHIPPDIASQSYIFTDNMRQKLNPRATRLLNKWGPSIFKQYKDEIGFGLILVSCVSVQTKQARYLMRKKANENKVATMPTPPTPVVPEPEKVAAGD